MTVGDDPRGRRATEDGGYWHFYHDPRGLALVRAEIHALTDGTGSEGGLLVKAEIRQMLQAAMNGKLRFGEKDDVSGIWREPDLCELRLTYRSFEEFEDGVTEPAGYKYRLYFAEPPQDQRLLLGLKFGRVPANEAGLNLQDEHIDCASDRYITGLSHRWGLR
ncbi:hypothetical protein [Specibacter sp. NPDC078692]|uniref:hypothetical protein n=1 Tax=Specibacter sp. NPDC078692 TaxID=3155818 RepID=UPI00342254ED